MPDLVSLVPFWLPQMDTDIKKSGDDKVIERPAPASSNPTTSTTPSDSPLPKARQDVYAEPVSEGEDGLDEDVDEDRLTQEAKASDESFWAGLPEGAAAEAKAFREKRLREEAAEVDGLLKVPSFGKADGGGSKAGAEDDNFAKLTPANLKRLLKMKKRPEERRKRKTKKGSTDGGSDDDLDDDDDDLDELEGDEEDESRATSASGKRDDPRKVGATAKREGKERGQPVEYVKNFKAPTGKKVSVPIRIEPKVRAL